MRQSRRQPLRPPPQADPPQPRREAARKRGAFAERIVADYLEAKGARILGLNVRVGRLELDIVARECDVVFIVEVRTRGAGSWQGALESIGREKVRRVREAGERLWSSRFASDSTLNHMRFDVATVEFRPNGEILVEHFRGAF